MHNINYYLIRCVSNSFFFFFKFQIAGPFTPQYEIYWKKLDPSGTGKVLPLDAAKFLKNSGLSDQTLGKVKLMMNLLNFIVTMISF